MKVTRVLLDKVAASDEAPSIGARNFYHNNLQGCSKWLK